MRFKTSHAVCQLENPAENAKEAVKRIKADLGDFEAGSLVFFASIAYDPETLAAEMQAAFPGVKTFGATSAGEGVNDKILTQSVVAMAFSPEVFALNEIGLILEDLPHRPMPAEPNIYPDARTALDDFCGRIGIKPLDLDYREFTGLLLFDRICPFGYSILDTVGDMTNVIFTGGFAGDDYCFDGQTRVFYQGHAYNRATVICLGKPVKGFELLKSQAVEMTDRNLVVTKADSDSGADIIWEFDHQPAAEALAKCLGKTVDTLGNDDFDDNPMGTPVDGEPFLRAALRVIDKKGLLMLFPTPLGTRINITRAGNVYEKTKKDLEAKLKEMEGDVGAVLHINCCSRHTALKKKDQTDLFAKLFSFAPCISLASYGEVYVGWVGMTSTMIFFR